MQSCTWYFWQYLNVSRNLRKCHILYSSWPLGESHGFEFTCHICDGLSKADQEKRENFLHSAFCARNLPLVSALIHELNYKSGLKLQHLTSPFYCQFSLPFKHREAMSLDIFRSNIFPVYQDQNYCCFLLLVLLISWIIIIIFIMDFSLPI